MFYATAENKHGLAHNPFKAIVAPRPIGWISSISAKGEVNLAPYSFFNAFSTYPPIVGFSSDGRKDSLVFAEETGEFVCNLATYDLREAVNATSEPLARGVSEMEKVGLTPVPSQLIKPPRVKESPCALECKWIQTIDLTDIHGASSGCWLVLGQVVGIYIDDAFIKDGLVDTAALQPLARCGYYDYAAVTETFVMKRPK